MSVHNMGYVEPTSAWFVKLIITMDDGYKVMLIYRQFRNIFIYKTQKVSEHKNMYICIQHSIAIRIAAMSFTS